MSKSFPTFCPLGPTIVTADEIADPHQFAISLTIDGVQLQNSNTRELVFKVPELIEHLSSITPLLPGRHRFHRDAAGRGSGPQTQALAPAGGNGDCDCRRARLTDQSRGRGITSNARDPLKTDARTLIRPCMELTGVSFLGTRRGSRGSATFHAFNPQIRRDAFRPPTIPRAPAEVEEAAKLAHEAFASYSQAWRQRQRPHFCAGLRMALTSTSKHWPSARISKPRCPCRGCLARWGAHPTSCACSPAWWKRAPGCRRASIRPSPIASPSPPRPARHAASAGAGRRVWRQQLPPRVFRCGR